VRKRSTYVGSGKATTVHISISIVNVGHGVNEVAKSVEPAKEAIN
jgi:hypothetical protein